MSNVRSAYRSLRPEITKAAVIEAREARNAAIDRLTQYTEDRFGPNLAAMTFQAFDGSFWPTGFVVEQGITARHAVPTGMRYDSKKNQIVPAKRTEEGKALVKELDSYGFSHPFIDGLGGVICGFNGDPNDRYNQARYFLGWTFEVLGEHVFAVLPVEHLDDRCDLTSWVKVPMSEYWSAKEAATDLAATDPQELTEERL